jgi:GxxExxY protein
MNENEISRQIVDAALKLHRKLGPGLFENVYEAVLAYELEKRGLKVRRQVPVPMEYEGLVFQEAYRLDLLVEEKVIVELKSIEKLATVHKKQTLTYLKLTNLHLALLINFGSEYLRDGIVRLVNKLPEVSLRP